MARKNRNVLYRFTISEGIILMAISIIIAAGSILLQLWVNFCGGNQYFGDLGINIAAGSILLQFWDLFLLRESIFGDLRIINAAGINFAAVQTCFKVHLTHCQNWKVDVTTGHN